MQPSENAKQFLQTVDIKV